MRTNDYDAENEKKGGETMKDKDFAEVKELKGSHKGKGFVSRAMGVLLAVALSVGTFGAGVGMWMSGGATEVRADDLVNTVPGDESYDASGTVTTQMPGPGGNSSHPGIDRGNEYTHQTTKVRQSQSTTSATTFASGAPLSTIYIDQTKINRAGSDNPQAYIESGGSNITYKLLASDPSFAPGIEYNAGDATVNYNPNKTSGLKPLVPGDPLVMSGPLYELTFKDAAIMPDGTKMHLKVTFSDATIYTDERLKSTRFSPQRYDGSAYLSVGANFRYGGTDARQLAGYTSTASGEPIYYVNKTAKEYGSSFASGAQNEKDGGARRITLGQRINATYQVVNDNGIPVEGSFVLAFAGINIDRDPYTGGGNNTAKPVWYVNENNTELDFFSESIGINTAGLASDYIYVRSNNNNLDDTNTPATNTKKTYYYPIITETGTGTDKVVKITANQYNNSGSMDNASYSTGFITVADSGKGITLTGYGHGSNTNSMQTSPFASTQLWYRYTASTGSHGNIQTTSEGNFNGTLSGGTVLEPSGKWNKGLGWDGSGTPGTGQAATHVVTEGKDVYYTMTPDIGYKIGKIWIGDTWDEDGNVTKYTEIEYNTEAVAKMKKGDTQAITTKAGKDGLLTYKEDGTYVLWFDHAEHHEAVHVEWEPTTADVLVAKRWQDENDKDGLRAVAYANESTKPKFKLQYSTNNGGNWEDVTTNQSPIPTTSTAVIHPSRTIDQEIIPDGKVGNNYVDGVYYINNDTTGDHPFTWEYLPVYTYDSNGTADRIILYRIVEIPDPAITDYENAQYYDTQYFDLTSPKTKTVDGWLIYRDRTDNKLYAGKSDGQYYEVDTNGIIASSPAGTQPLKENLGTISSSDYYTVDKAIPYQTVEAKNEHKPFEISIEFTKKWNDAELYDENGPIKSAISEYDRKNLKFILHGVNQTGEIVDLNGDETSGNDIEIVINKDEKDAREYATSTKKVEGQTVYSDGTREYVLRDEDEDGTETYYTYTASDNGDGTFTYAYEEATPQPSAADVAPDNTYKIDTYNFGALVENLPTHYNGTKITYTISEVDKDTKQPLDAWIVTGGQLSPVLNDKDELVGYTTSFVNTPMVDSTVNPLPLTINKKDKLTDSFLEGATFTVYSNYVANEKAGESETAKVGGYDLITDNTNDYVKKEDGKYYEVTGDIISDTAADPQPNPNDLHESKIASTETVEGQTVYTDGTDKYVLKSDGYYTFTQNADGSYEYTKAGNQDAGTMKESKIKGAVDENEVVTNSSGQVTINFNESGTYYVKETKAPTGYEVDSTVYTFVVDKELQKVELKDADADHNKMKWWEVIYDILYKGHEPAEAEWVESPDHNFGTLTVKNDPIRAQILVNKVWDDNNNQDGLRSDPAVMPKVKIQKTTDPSDESNWVDVDTSANISAPDKDVPDHDASIYENIDNYYTWKDLPAYENGKLLYYRVIEEGGTLPDGSAMLPGTDHAEESAYAWTAITATDPAEVFNIANVTDPANPTPRNRTVVVTNKHTPRKMKLTVSKEWTDDNGDADLLRKKANVTLYKTVNGVETEVGTKDNVVPIDDYTEDFTNWENLPVYENGYPITYRIEESGIDHYGTSYKKIYTSSTAGSVDAGGDSVDASDVNRTFEDKTVSGKTVYTDGKGNDYVKKDDNKYYAVTGDMISDTEAYPQPDPADLTTISNETTEAEVKIKNYRLTEVTVSKTWINGATSNITYKLYRTTSTDPAVTDWDTATPGTGISGTTSIIDSSKTVYDWTPDPNWEEVPDVTVTFRASDFTNSTSGSTKTEIISGLPVADPATGKTYTYRVKEFSGDTSRYEADQTGNTAVTNTNAKAANGYASVNVVKELSGRSWNNSDKFYFKIEPVKYLDTDSDGNPDAYGIDQDGKPITDPDLVPLPASGTETKDIQDVDMNDKQVGAIGRNVAFEPIEYTSTQVDLGKDAEYYYKVYEVYDNLGESLDTATSHTGKKDGITYAGKVESGTFKPEEHIVKVAVKSDSAGVITTDVFWDGYAQSAVPVYTNTYDASVEVYGHVVKQVLGRDMSGADKFNFTGTNIGGSPLRNTETGDVETDATTKLVATIEDDTDQKVSPSGDNYDPVSEGANYYRATKTDISTWIRLSDLGQKTNNGLATDTFIYEFKENPGTGNNASKANNDDLIFDDKTIYMKVVATDDGKGNININKTYHTDASCTSDNIVNANVLVYKNDDTAATPAYHKGDLAPVGAAAGEDYEYVPAALFVNTQNIDIPVKKEWVDGPAIEDVGLHLQRKLFSLDDEPTLTYANAESRPGHDGTTNWHSVGKTYTAKRSDFLNNDGTPKYDQGSTTTSSETYERIAEFNKELPKYVNVKGTTYRAIYKLTEDNTSDAYETSFRSSKTGESDTDGNQIFIDGETLIVTNKVTATNVAKIAAVKQLQGRSWLSTDDFDFILEADGIGTYNTDGSFDKKDPKLKNNVPMPERYVNNSNPDDVITATAYSKLPDADKANYTKQGTNEADATATDTTVDPNGNLERLARFDEIVYTTNNLTYDAGDKHMQGDFFYIMKEKIPADAKNASGQTYGTEGATGPWIKNGITYDGDVHRVHVKVRENRTGELQVQIAYDETEEGKISTGTQFTPVYTNKYDAGSTAEVSVTKFIKGRDFEAGETFTFEAKPIGNAPFVDKDGNPFANETAEVTITGEDGTVGTVGQTAKLPKLQFALSDLNLTVGKDGDKDPRGIGTEPKVIYSDGVTVAAEGTKYGRFVYAITEKEASDSDLKKDEDVEYVRVTVINKNDGTLDIDVKYYEDRYCTKERTKPGTTDPADAAYFVNKTTRDISATKAWSDPAISDVTLKLQWSVNDGANWYDVANTPWMNRTDGTKVIAKDAIGDALTVTWEDLPTYSNYTSNIGDMGDENDLNDKWIIYRIKEDSIGLVDTMYNTEAYKAGDTKDTKKEGSEEKKYTAPDSTGGSPFTTEAETATTPVTQLYVTNFRQELTGEARFGVVKQYIGKVWESEEFTFEVNPVKSALGDKANTAKPDESDFTDYDQQTTKKMPTLGTNNTATASISTDKVSVNERAANFSTPLTIKLSDLETAADGVAKGIFYYDIKEKIPEGVTAMTEGGKTYYVKRDANGNTIKYTTDTYTLKIIAIDDGSGNIKITESFDDRGVGEFVPVYTNYAMVKTPLKGTKTWSGGPVGEHKNGTVTLNDEATEVTGATDLLGLELKRKLNKTNEDGEQTLTTDDAGRPLVIVWAKEEVETNTTTTTDYVQTEDTTVDTTKTYYRYDDATQSYIEVTPAGTEVPSTEDGGWYEAVTTTTTETTTSFVKQEGGDGNGPYTYTVMAKDGDDYVAPILKAVDNEGYTYDYYIEETKTPDGYTKSEDGMAVTNSNIETVNVPVTKEWKGGPAVEDVTIRLQRALVPEGTSIEYDNLDGYTWTNTGLLYNIRRASFMDGGNPDYDQTGGDTSTMAYDGTTTDPATPHHTDYIEVFKKLPKHTTENGVDYRILYKIIEDDSSAAYEISYRTENGTGDDKVKTDTGAYYVNDGDMPVITNTVKATNEANIAAVKQFMGRQWLSTDKFEFTLVPAGKAVYYTETEAEEYNTQHQGKEGFTPVHAGDFKEVTDTTKASIPMPENNTDRESETIGEVATTHARKAEDKYPVVDPNGGMERLARFGEIKYEVSDLEYDPTDKYMHGDFYYIMKEKLPDIVTTGDNQNYPVEYTVIEKVEGQPDKTVTKTIDDKAMPTLEPGETLKSIKFSNGITYDCDEHKVHVKVRENRTKDLVVQVAYDYTDPDDISTGTQFTPVYTNRYDAVGKQNATIQKYVMGRELIDEETFEFEVAPVGGAPFRNEDGSDITEGKFTVTIKVGEEGSDRTHENTAIEKTDKSIDFKLEDLSWVVGKGGKPDSRDNTTDPTVTYKDASGNDVTATEGMKYGRFMYSVKETNAFSADMNVDPGTEYVRVTVVDIGDGTLGTSYKIFGNASGTIKRMDPDDPAKDATKLTLVNQQKRDLHATKKWTRTATSDVTLKLQWSVNPGDTSYWHDADGTEWLSSVRSSYKIDREAKDDELTVDFANLPAYVNMTDKEYANNVINPAGDDLALNDRWVYYRVVEDSVANVDTRYSTDPNDFKIGDDVADYPEETYSADKIYTESEADHKAGTSVSTIYVGNFPKELEGEAHVNVVKQFLGKSWEGEVFNFKIEPVKGIDAQGKAIPYSDTPKDEEAKAKVPMPSKTEGTTVVKTDTATASAGIGQVSVNEHRASFDAITITSDDLIMGDDGIARKEFYYKIYEPKPDGATEYTKDGKTYYIDRKDGSTTKDVKYTSEEHTVKITAMDDGSGKITTTVSYDGRDAGDFVPVYTNEAVMPVPVSGTKTWIGGEDSEHAVVDGEGNDRLGIKLERKIPSAPEWEKLSKDDAGNDLKVVWEKNDQDEYTGKFSFMAVSGDDLIQPVLDEADDMGNEYDYRIEELAQITDYEVSYETKTIDNNNIINNAITNTCVRTDNLKVTKTWDDKNNEAGLRAEAKVYLYADGTLVGEVTEGTVTTTDGEVKTWSDLPVYTADGTDGDKKIRYTVKETAVPGYTTSYEPEEGVELGDTETTIAITNKHVPETGELTIKKHWDDNDDQDGFRAGSITVKLYAKTIDGGEAKVFDGASDKEVTISAADSWKYEFTGDNKLPTTFDGKAVIYYVDGKSETFDGGDKSKYTHTFVERTGDTEITVTNIHKPEEGCVEVLKVWDDNNNQDGKRQDAVMTLKATTGTGDTAKTTTVGEKTISADINEPQEAVWHDLPVYRNGEKITYTVEEAEIDGYTPSVSDPVQLDGDNDTKKITVTNTYEPETTSVTVIKKWKDGDDQDKKRSDVTMHLKGIIEGAEFKSLNFEDKIIPVNTTAKDGEDAGTATWTDLPVYHDGKKITYDVTEEAVPGYTSNVEMSEGHATVTNERATDVTYVEVTKVWNDADNVDGMRTDVTVTLEKTVDGKKSDVDSKTIATGDNHDENMTASWSGLPANEDGKPITYTVREDDINGYTGETSSTEPGKFTITNTHEPEKTNVKVTKVWDDNNNADRLRPNSVNVVLYADGKPVEIKSITTPEDAQTESKVTFTVPKNRTGAHDEAITYTVKEEKVPEGYTASEPTGDQHNGYTITNTHVPGTGSLKITKIWDDADDQDGLRPKELTVKLTGDDSKDPYEETITLKESEDWTTTVNNLRLYKTGSTDEKVTYTVSDETVETTDDYKVTFDTDTAKNPDYIISYSAPTTLEADRISELTVTNKHEPDTIDIAVDKTWYDSNDQDGVRPNEVRIELSNDFDDNIKVITLNAQNNWTDIFRGLRKNSSKGTAIVYKVAETISAALENAGYVAEPKQNKDGSWTITNTRNENDITQVTLTKIWDDGDNQDGFRPNAAAFADSLVLKADGTETGRKPATKKDNGDGTYTYTWTGLRKNRTKTSETQETVPIDYKVEEKTVPDEYTASDVTGDMAEGYSITNTHAVRNIDVISVTKVWIDGNNRDGKRPHSTENKMFIWATTSDDPENAPDEEWILIGNASVEDNNDLDGRVSINEWRKGDSIDGERLDVNGDLTLPAYKDGKLVTYKLTESLTDNSYTQKYKRNFAEAENLLFDYESELISGVEFLTVINSKDVDFTVTKKWDDKDSNAVRPDEDTYKDSLKLYVTPEDGNTTEVTKDYAGKLNVVKNYDGTYTATWSALPQYTDEPDGDGGNRLHYHVVEDKINGYNDPVYSNVDDPTVFDYNDHKAVDESAVTDKAYDHGVITNTAVTYDSLKITKTWDDEKNAEGLRPDSVTFHLYKKTDDGQVSAGVEEKTLAADANPAEVTWEDLPVYEDGAKITYVVLEEAVSGYTTKYVTNDVVTNEVQLDGTTGAQAVNVTNSLTPATTKVAVTKIWDDESNRDRKRPEDGVTFKLYERVWDEATKKYGDEKAATKADGTAIAELTLDGTADTDTTKEVKETAPADATNKWNGEFTNLPETKNGKTVIYYVKETTDLTGSNYKTAVVTGNQLDGYEITNSRNRDTTSASITKKWIDSSARFMRPDTLGLELWRYYEGADNKLAYERVTDDADGNAVKTTISYDDAVEGDEDSWALTVPNLPVNNEQGKAYTYYWKEPVPANYETPSVRPANDPAPGDTAKTEGAGDTTRVVKVANGWSIANTLSILKLRVNKIWADGNDREDKRPMASVYLEATTDDPVTEDTKWKPVGWAYVDKNDGRDGQVPLKVWYSGSGLFDHGEQIDKNGEIILPVSEDGDVITYRLTERDQGNEYTTSYKLAVSEEETTDEILFTFNDKEITDECVVAYVTNTFNPDFSVTKKWVDEEGNTVRPSADKYKESLKLFATEFTLNNETFEYDPETKEVTEDYADKLKVTDNKDGTYTATWKELPQYGEDGPVFDGSNRIIYHVKETKVDGYEDAAYSNTEDPASETKEAEATDKAYDHGVITNTQSIPQRTIKVTKEWKDEALRDTDGYVRPKDVSVQLYKGEGEDEEAYGDPVGLSEANKWTYSWSVPAEANGKPIAYTIKEVNVPAGFTSSGDVKVSEDTAEEDYTITNTPKPVEKVNSIDLVVVKTNKKDDVLSGAEFTVTSPSGSKTPYTSNDKGELQITFDEEGEYIIEETKAPNGYKTDGKKYTVAVTKEKVEVKYDKAADSWKTIYDLIFNKDEIAGDTQERNTAGTALVVGNPPNTHTLTVVKNYSGIDKLPDTFAVDVTYTDAEGKEVPVTLSPAQGTAAAGSVTWTIPDVPYGSSVNVSEKGYEAARYTVKADGSKSLIMPDADAPVTLKNEYTEQDKITIKYTDGQGKDITSKEIYKGDPEPDQSEVDKPTREGYRFTGWNRTVDEGGNVTYEAGWEKIPDPEKITISYKDPSKPEGEQTVFEETIDKGSDEPAQPTDPTREGYTFGGWKRSVDKDGNVTYEAQWVEKQTIPDPEKITISYKDPSKPEGEQTVLEETIDRGKDEPAQPEDPTREGYTFGGWKRSADKDGNVTYEAQWVEKQTIPEPETLTVTYIDGQGNTLHNDKFKRGDNEPVWAPAEYPTRDGFIFGGWIRSLDDKGNVTYTANWIENPEPAPETRTITYIDPMAENALIKSKHEGEAGANIDPEGTPAHDDMDFVKWDEVKDADGNIIRFARYVPNCDNVQNKTLVRYRSIDGEKEDVYQTSYINEGDDIPPYAGDEPVREGYLFDGWGDPEYVKDDEGKITDIFITAKWKEVPKVKTHTVKYVDPDGHTIYLEKTGVKEGDKVDPPENPTREGYDFDGWTDPVTDPDTGDVTYTAKWKEKPPVPEKTHTVEYVDEDGTGYYGPVTVKEGEKEPDAPEDPKKDGYIFGGWIRNVDKDGNVTYTAKWLPDTHTVTYVDGRTGKVIEVVPDIPLHGDAKVPDAPAHEGYEFKGWRTPDGELVTDLKVKDVIRDLVYTAVYDPTEKPVPLVHTVTFIDSITGDEIKVDNNVPDGGSTATPVVPDHQDENYVFKGWWTQDNELVTDLQVEDVREDQIYVAIYDRVYQEAVIGKRIIHFRYIDKEGREVEDDRVDSVRFTRTATVDGITGETTFSEWTPRYHTFPEEDVPVVEGYTTDDTIPEQTVWPNGKNEELWVIYTPVATEETKTVSRTVKFRYYTVDGEEASADVVQTVTLKSSWTIDPDTKERVYTDWEITGREQEDPQIPEIEGFTPDMTKVPEFVVDLKDPKDGEDVVVIYSKIPQKTFTVTFTDGFGNELKVQEGIPEHGSAVEPVVPDRKGYRFAGWDVAFDDVTGDMTVTATWQKVRTVIYQDPDGTIHQEDIVDYDDKDPDAPKDIVKNGYIFDGWDKEVDEHGNVIYTARWIPEPQPDTFWVTYVDEDGTVYLEKTTVKKGDKEPDQPKVSKDGYIFGGWNRIVDKDGNVTYTAVWFKAENPDNPDNPENPVVPQQSDKSAAPNGTNVTTITNPVTGKPMTVVRPESTGGAYTGDNNGTLLWIILAVASAGAGLTAIAIRRRRQREE